MAFPSPLGGNIGARTATIYRLDPTGIVPLEPLIDIVPGLTPFRVTADLIDSEGKTNTYDVTTHPIKFGQDVTSHVRKRLKALNLTFTLGATLPILPTAGIVLPGGGAFGGGVIPQLPVGNDIFVPKVPPVPGSQFRMDLVRLNNLELIADALFPVMVITPRVGLPKAFITSLSHNWTPSLGESTQITISFMEANIVSALPSIPSDAGLAPGKTTNSGAGTSSPSPAGTSATPSATPGVAPTVL